MRLPPGHWGLPIINFQIWGVIHGRNCGVGHNLKEPHLSSLKTKLDSFAHFTILISKFAHAALITLYTLLKIFSAHFKFIYLSIFLKKLFLKPSHRSLMSIISLLLFLFNFLFFAYVEDLYLSIHCTLHLLSSFLCLFRSCLSFSCHQGGITF